MIGQPDLDANLPNTYAEKIKGTEQLLVRMMGERRSWDSVQDIAMALRRIRTMATDMDAEQAHLSGENSEAALKQEAAQIEEGFEHKRADLPLHFQQRHANIDG